MDLLFCRNDPYKTEVRQKKGIGPLGVQVPSHQLAWKCKKALSKRKVVFLQGSVFHVSWWQGVATRYQAAGGNR